MRWACGVTTVPSRRGDLLPQTLASLKAAGFPPPRLFIDGWDGRDDSYSWALARPGPWELEWTCHHPAVRVHGNWELGLRELVIRNPDADRFAIFQDDLVMCRNVRQYLERCPWPEGMAYKNLYCWPDNQRLAPKTKEGGTQDGFFRSNQRGRGALALVFNRESAALLLSHPRFNRRPLDLDWGWRRVDGGIVDSLSGDRYGPEGWAEWVHSPSLCQHTGAVSSFGNNPHPPARSFPGEEFDALTLLGSNLIGDFPVAAGPQLSHDEAPTGGAAAYFKLPEPLCSSLVAAWQQEMRALQDAIRGDMERLRDAGSRRERTRLNRIIDNYRQQLRRLQVNESMWLPDEDAKRMVAECLQKGKEPMACSET